MNDILSKPRYDLTDEEEQVAPALSAHHLYEKFRAEQAPYLTIVPTYHQWLEQALWTEQGSHAVLDEAFTHWLDEMWKLVYPGKTDWDYPAMVWRHVRDYIDELRSGIDVNAAPASARVPDASESEAGK